MQALRQPHPVTSSSGFVVQRIEQIRYLPNFAHRSSPCEAHRGPADFSTMTLTGHGEKGMHATVDGKKRLNLAGFRITLPSSPRRRDHPV